MNSQFVSMSFVIPLDYSVVHAGVVDHQHVVTMYSSKGTVLMYHRAPVIPGFDSY